MIPNPSVRLLRHEMPPATLRHQSACGLVGIVPHYGCGNHEQDDYGGHYRRGPPKVKQGNGDGKPYDIAPCGSQGDTPQFVESHQYAALSARHRHGEYGYRQQAKPPRHGAVTERPAAQQR